MQASLTYLLTTGCKPRSGLLTTGCKLRLLTVAATAILAVAASIPAASHVANRLVGVLGESGANIVDCTKTLVNHTARALERTLADVAGRHHQVLEGSIDLSKKSRLPGSTTRHLVLYT